MQLPDGFAIGPMTAPEVDVLVGWAADEGWNPGVHDVAIAYREQPAAFLALRRGTELVGGASVMAYGEAWGFLGLFIVRADLRSQGLGTCLWDELLASLRGRLAPDAPIGLDGVVAMQPFYRRSGFVDAYRDIRFSGHPVCAADPQVTSQNGEVTCESWTPCSGAADVALCSIEGGGHAWPGSTAYPIGKSFLGKLVAQSFADIWPGHVTMDWQP